MLDNMIVSEFQVESEGGKIYKFSQFKLSSVQNLPEDVKQKFEVGMKFDSELNRITCSIPDNSEAAWV